MTCSSIDPCMDWDNCDYCQTLCMICAKQLQRKPWIEKNDENNNVQNLESKYPMWWFFCSYMCYRKCVFSKSNRIEDNVYLANGGLPHKKPKLA